MISDRINVTRADNGIRITNCWFYGIENAQLCGGAIFCSNSLDKLVISIDYSVFSGCTAIEGGCIYFSSSQGNITIHNSVFTENIAQRSMILTGYCDFFYINRSIASGLEEFKNYQDSFSLFCNGFFMDNANISRFSIGISGFSVMSSNSSPCSVHYSSFDQIKSVMGHTITIMTVSLFSFQNVNFIGLVSSTSFQIKKIYVNDLFLSNCILKESPFFEVGCLCIGCFIDSSPMPYITYQNCFFNISKSSYICEIDLISINPPMSQKVFTSNFHSVLRNRDLSGLFSIIGSFFIDIHVSENGGAIILYSPFSFMEVIDCVFRNTSSLSFQQQSQGGAIFFDCIFGKIKVISCCFSNCAASIGQSIKSVSLQPLRINTSSVVACQYPKSESTIASYGCCISMNSSDNYGRLYSSFLSKLDTYLEFSNILSNIGDKYIGYSIGVHITQYYQCNFLRNQAEILFVSSSFTIKSCIFSENSFDRFFESDAKTFFFVQCSFDQNVTINTENYFNCCFNTKNSTYLLKSFNYSFCFATYNTLQIKEKDLSLLIIIVLGSGSCVFALLYIITRKKQFELEERALVEQSIALDFG